MLLNLIETIVAVLCCTAAAVHCVHVFQMNRYQLPAFGQWIGRSREAWLKNVIVGFVVSVLSWYLPYFLTMFSSVPETRNDIAGWITLVVYLAAAVPLIVRDLRAPMKKPLVMTLRAKRLIAAVAVLFAVFVVLLELLKLPPYLAYAAVPYVTWLGGRIMHPIEEKINQKFYDEAKLKLRVRKDLIKIGITGSSGKTLTKFILKELLSEKYEVLATPASYNTAMGISRVVNDQLEDKHQVFIAEMGAQHVGEIKHLAKLVRPQYGMITSIGTEHIESFGSISNIVETKYELIRALPENGAAFFASDSGYSDRMFSMCEREKYNAAVELEGDYYMHASELKFTREGTRFVLECNDGGAVCCRTRLLGRYNVQNIALAASVARKLGLTMEEIAKGIAKLPPFEKKLQLIPGERTIIDDSLNNTPLGTAEALNVLSEFPGRRILVTPGLPQLDLKGEDVNYAFGAQITGCADAVILVGSKAKLSQLIRGMINSGFSKSAMRIVADMNDAEDLLAEIARPGDTVLYESSIDE